MAVNTINKRFITLLPDLLLFTSHIAGVTDSNLFSEVCHHRFVANSFEILAMPLPASVERPKAGRSTGQIEAKPGAVRGATLSIQKLLDAFLDGVIERNDYGAEKAKLMSRKKSLEEQIAALSTNRANWLEPFQEWILTAKNADEIAVSGFPQEKKVLARQVFGSNFVLDCKKARGSCVKPWSLLVEKIVEWWSGARDRT